MVSFDRASLTAHASAGRVDENLLMCDADVDILSTSAIHQGVPHVDFSLKINH